jgi:hypothetical protein
MLAQVLVLSVFAAGMISVLVLSQRGPREPGEIREAREDPGEPEELRAAA